MILGNELGQKWEEALLSAELKSAVSSATVGVARTFVLLRWLIELQKENGEQTTAHEVLASRSITCDVIGGITACH